MASKWCKDLDLKSELDEALQIAKQDLGQRVGAPRPPGLSRYLAHPRTISGIAPAKKWTGGVRTDEDCVAIFVPRKLGAGGKGRWPGRREDEIPRSIKLESGREVVTDVIEARFHALSPHGAQGMAVPQGAVRRGFVSPAQPGCSISGATTDGRLTAGTLGAFLQDRGGAKYILSCNHVLALEDPNNLTGAIHQPGQADCPGNDPMAAGVLAVPLIGNQAATQAGAPAAAQGGPQAGAPAVGQAWNKVDAAIAEVRGRAVDPGFVQVDGYSPSKPQSPDPLSPEEGMKVFKVGRTTGYTEGVIHAAASTPTAVDEYAQGTLLFERQAIITVTEGFSRFADDGDSGSLVVSCVAPYRPVGMLIGASRYYAVASWFSVVLEELKREFNKELMLVI